MIKVAVVGLGWWGKIITKMLATSSRISVIAAVEPNEQEGKAFCELNQLKYLPSYTLALQQQDIDAVILTTPNRLHEEQITLAAQAGKHVFCEKPLALTVESALKAIHACSVNNVRLGLGHERRFEPPTLLLRQLLMQGELGRLIQIEGNFSQNKFIGMDPSNWRLSKTEAGCGPMTATGIHLLNLAISLAGPALQVRAHNFNKITGFESGDSASAQLVFADGVVGSINAMLSTPFYSRFAVFGSEGWVEIRDNSHVEAPTGWTVSRCDRNNEITVMNVPAATPVKDNLEAFAASIGSGQENYPISHQEMLDTTAALEAVQLSTERLGETVIPTAPRLERR